ncbi:MAG: hypothetical protein NTW52_15010 [Planctomycetota bacterium]|nr:hypothetical protein [Planctomycetota bacterium]
MAIASYHADLFTDAYSPELALYEVAMRIFLGSALLMFAALPLCVGCGDASYVEEPEASERVADAGPPLKPFESRVAEVGVGIKGQSLRDETGVGKIISQPAMTLFTTKEKVAFEILIPQAMGLFEGFNGRKPETHEEFMEKIIKEQRIELPKLPTGQVYRYHPDDFQLWVEAAPAE